MERSEQLRKCSDFLHSHRVAVVATASPDGIPHAASVNYLSDDNCSIFFVARKHSHKFNNIINNPQVWVVVSDPEYVTSVEVRGTPYRVDDEKRATELLSEISKLAQAEHLGPLPIMRIPGSEPHLFQVKPNQIIYADFRPTQRHNGEFFEIAMEP